MSLLGKKWVIQNSASDIDLIERILVNRNIGAGERAAFLEGGKEQIHDPNLLKGMGTAVKRIRQAIDQKEPIMVFGDYDVDGISGTAVLLDFLRKVGANARYTLPHREDDGYGLKEHFVRRFAEEAIKLIVTVDCGTASFNEVKLANELGLEVVITDHHSMPAKLPPAVAILNPHQPDCVYPNKELSGSAVAYKLVCVLAPYYLKGDELTSYLDAQLGIAALGLVADCMSLLSHENRVMVREGMNALMSGAHPGISALLKEAGIAGNKITSSTVGFQIGPRLNAAGRLDKPDHSLELLLGNVDKATLLGHLNKERQVMIEEYMKGVIAYLESRPVPPIIVILSKEWRSGLLGLIASKVVDKYQRPVIVMQDKGDELVASMRSLNGFDITGTLRGEAGELFSAFGGHAMAGGFTLPKANLIAFLEKIKTIGDKSAEALSTPATLTIDCTIQARELTEATVESLQKLEPFGNDNPLPMLAIQGVKISQIRPVGSKGEHLQFPIEASGKSFKAIAFRLGQHLGKIDPTQTYDVAFNLEINEWNGRRNIQLKVVDLKPSEL